MSESKARREGIPCPVRGCRGRHGLRLFTSLCALSRHIVDMHGDDELQKRLHASPPISRPLQHQVAKHRVGR